MGCHYVYSYHEQGSGNPFYIGKGTGDRAESHTRPHFLSRKTMFYCKLRSIINSGNQPEVRYVQRDMSEEAAFALEKKLIRQYGRRDIGTGCLTNHTDGGDGPSGNKMSLETRQKMSSSRIGLTHSPETRLKMSAWQVGRKIPTDTIEKSKRTRAARHGTPIESFCLLTSVTIKKYSYISEAKEDGFSNNSIHLVLNGKVKSHGNLGWRYS